MATTVLVVDDNRTVRLFCKEELEKHGFRVSVAQNGHQAMKFLKTIWVDVIVLDIHLPHKNGIELSKEFRSQFPKIPIIFHSTSYHVSADFDWVMKSEDIGPLVAAIARVVDAACDA